MVFSDPQKPGYRTTSPNANLDDMNPDEMKEYVKALHVTVNKGLENIINSGMLFHFTSSRSTIFSLINAPP